MASYSQALDILEPLSEAMDPDEAARVVELSVYCMVESARCYHNLSQVRAPAPNPRLTPTLERLCKTSSCCATFC